MTPIRSESLHSYPEGKTGADERRGPRIPCSKKVNTNGVTNVSSSAVRHARIDVPKPNDFGTSYAAFSSVGSWLPSSRAAQRPRLMLQAPEHY